jgi:DNA-directed RNA polymerase specialized sigma24 family protein
MMRSTPTIRPVKVPSQQRRRRPPLDELVLASAFHHVRDRLRGRVAARARRQRLDFMLEDLLGAADLGLCLAVRTWTPTRGPLEPYAWLFVQRETGRELRRELRRRAVQTSAPAMIDAADEADTMMRAARDTVASSLAERGCDARDVALATAHWQEGRSLRSLAAAHTLSFRQVHQAVARVRTRVLETLTGGGPMQGSVRSHEVPSDAGHTIAVPMTGRSEDVWN